MSEFVDKVSKRRTFAIISHPDAGKTTLTEKFLLYGGAIQEAVWLRVSRICVMQSVTGWKLKNREGFLLHLQYYSSTMMGSVSIS